LNHADKNKHLMAENIDEKVYVINNVVPNFSRQFIEIPVEVFEIIADFFFVIINLYFLINARSLNLIPLIVIFVLINII